MDSKKLFNELFFAKTEEDLDKVLSANPDIFMQGNWYPLGGNKNNFGLVETQQSSPIAALIEKITNSIDAILMKKCYEMDIDPKSSQAPRSMEEAIKKFYPDNKNWDLKSNKRKQSEEIQIIADGHPKNTRNTSVIIYDNGEGQFPEDFENTFLSLLRGNKSEIQFVQGKYNMGGSGVIVFCGKKRYQLVASRRFQNSNKIGFTLTREYPLKEEETKTKRNTWYEYLKVDGQIPFFEADEIDLGLYGRKFKTGTIIKLYSYQFPPGYSGFAQDLNQSINEFLFEPALPLLTVDKKERYPNNKVLDLDLYGLKRRLEEEKYVDDLFSENYDEELFGKMKVSCYVFKSRLEKREIKESKKIIRNRFFKNNMSVLFSLNGQVHGDYSSEFITRSLKLNLLKDLLLIHVDCSKMKYSFRKELFMASRDRLKKGDETNELRKFLAKKLGAKNGRLAEIEKMKINSISVDSGDTKELLKSFTKSLPMNKELLKLLGQTFKLDQKKDKPEKKDKKKKDKKEEKEPFMPERFPSCFKIRAKNDGEKEVAKIPLGGEKTIRFDTDVENNYFDRVEEPGELRIALLDYKTNESRGGNAPGKIDKIEDAFNVNKSSPKDGTIKICLNPKAETNSGDAARIKATLTGPGREFDEIFWVKISDPEAKEKDSKKEDEKDEQDLGLPEYVLAYQEQKNSKTVTWQQVEDATTEAMNYETVLYPMVNGENLEKVYINMDSSILKNFKSKYKNISEDQIEVADKKYISSVYFHTLFLYTITKNRKYKLSKEKDGKDEEVGLNIYLKDLFDSYYSEFILNFGTNELMQGLGD